MNTTNNFNFSSTNNLNFLDQNNVKTNNSHIKGGRDTVSYHTRSLSTNPPFKLTNFLISKHHNPFKLEETNQYFDYEELAERNKLSKLINVSKAKFKENKHDFVITFEDKPIQRPRKNNQRIYNDNTDKEKEKDNINKSSFEFPSIITNKSMNKTARIGDICGYEATNSKLESIPKKEVRLRDQIKNNIETNYASSLDISNNMKLIDKRFDDLQNFQESEMLKIKMGVDNIVKEEIEEDVENELDQTGDIVSSIYEKVKNKHLKKNERYRKIDDDLKNQRIEETNSLWRMNKNQSYEVWVSHKNSTSEINQRINGKNLIEDINYLNNWNDTNKAEFKNFNEKRRKEQQHRKRPRKSIFDMV